MLNTSTGTDNILDPAGLHGHQSWLQIQLLQDELQSEHNYRTRTKIEHDNAQH